MCELRGYFDGEFTLQNSISSDLIQERYKKAMIGHPEEYVKYSLTPPPPPPPQKILHKYCLQFLLGQLQYPGEMKNKSYAKLLGGWGGELHMANG